MTTTEITEYRPATQHCRCGNSWRVELTADRKTVYANADDDDAALDCSGSHGSLATVFDDQPVTDQQLAEHWAQTAGSHDYQQPIAAENLSDLAATVEPTHTTKEPAMTTTTEATRVTFPRPTWATSTRENIDGIEHFRGGTLCVIDSTKPEPAVAVLTLSQEARIELQQEALEVTIDPEPVISLDDVGEYVTIDGARRLMAALSELVAAYDAATVTA